MTLTAHSSTYLNITEHILCANQVNKGEEIQETD